MAESTGETAPFSGHTGPVYAVAYSPDGTTLASGGGTAPVWDVRYDVKLGTLSGHSDSAGFLAAPVRV